MSAFGDVKCESLGPGAGENTFQCISIWVYNFRMARAATTADAFNAVAEPRRREILDALAGGERPVNELVDLLGLAQPHVSRHLRVLREVGAVDVRDEGRRRLYRLNPRALKPIHDWVASYQHLWAERFDLLEDVLEDLKEQEI
jgi:DNA-binding transcriptional ArsR family regulator